MNRYQFFFPRNSSVTKTGAQVALSNAMAVTSSLSFVSAALILMAARTGIRPSTAVSGPNLYDFLP